MKIGTHSLANNLILAPMAGVTDRPFRQLCRRLGAGLAVSEMVTSNASLWKSNKTRLRLDHEGEHSPRSVQIAGADPVMMANAARFNVENGAEIIDINMGCPAKKVCKVLAGSALMRDEGLVRRILEAVVSAVDVPVTLKIRTGWDPEHRNGLTVARIAEESGVAALAVHGRTRACGFRGNAEYDTVKRIKHQVNMPVLVNGDIRSARDAAGVMDETGADGVMIGRAAQGNPWIFSEIAHYLSEGIELAQPTASEVAGILLEHLDALYTFYGEYRGVRIARKHIGWYCKNRSNADSFPFRHRINRAESAVLQTAIVREYFLEQEERELAA